MKDWRKIKAKTRQLRLNESESDYALRQQMMRFGGIPDRVSAKIKKKRVTENSTHSFDFLSHI